jgi:Protein of unknown function (DUF3592)
MVVTVKTASMPKDREAWLGLMWLGLFALLLLSGLGSIFVLVVTAVEARQEHSQAQWPETTAYVVISRLERSSTGRRQRFRIHCRLGYEIGAERDVTNLYSRYVPGPDVPQYPANQIEPFDDWVEDHPPGTPIPVRYDPGDHAKAVLVTDYMPYGGPRTTQNVKLLEAVAGAFLVLLVIARIVRPTTPR